jgi:hypothetical protein
MSLKAFHLIFITAASALAFGCGVWELRNYWSTDGRMMDLAIGAGSLAAGVALLLYERYFFKKLKHISYL